MPAISRFTDVAAALRKDIAAGKLKPGQRLPNRIDLGKRFNAGMSVVQRAIDDLMQDGLLHARPRAGTFVADDPAAVRRLALVAPDFPSRFYQALRESAAQVAKELDVEFESYFVSGMAKTSDDAVKLCKDVREHRLGGVIFLAPPFPLVGTPAVDEPGIPRVAMQNHPSHNCSSVYVDGDSFLDRAIEYLTKLGRKCIAHIITSSDPQNTIDFEKRVRQRKIEVRHHWIQSIPPTVAFHPAERIVACLMHLDGENRPDAMILHDDNLIEPAVAGLLMAGVKVPAELTIVAHCNFPAAVPTPLPLRRLGFDCRQLIREAIKIVEKNRKQKDMPFQEVYVRAVFEDEMKPAPVMKEASR